MTNFWTWTSIYAIQATASPTVETIFLARRGSCGCHFIVITPVVTSLKRLTIRFRELTVSQLQLPLCQWSSQLKELHLLGVVNADDIEDAMTEEDAESSSSSSIEVLTRLRLVLEESCLSQSATVGDSDWLVNVLSPRLRELWLANIRFGYPMPAILIYSSSLMCHKRYSRSSRGERIACRRCISPSTCQRRYRRCFPHSTSTVPLAFDLLNASSGCTDVTAMTQTRLMTLWSACMIQSAVDERTFLSRWM